MVNNNTYIGQVALVPPVDMVPLNLSFSWGIIVIKTSQRWDYIWKDKSLDLNETDTICREMGYTHSVVNSLQTVQYLRDEKYFELKYL